MKSKLKHYLVFVGISLLIVVLDQLTKTWIIRSLNVGESIYPIPWLAPFFRFIHWKNTGAAFGIFQNGNDVLKILTSIIAIVVAVYYYQVPEDQKLVRIPLSMMFGGAVGNLIDRFTLGYVTDFVAVGSFPVFNVADSSVTVGVGLLILAMTLEEHKAKKALETAENEAREMPTDMGKDEPQS